MTTPGLPHPRADWCLFLDFDGTLVEIADSPEAVRAECHLATTLSAIAVRLDGALAIVSGRPVSEIDRHLDHEGFLAAGLHGLEMRRGIGQPVARVDVDPPAPEIRKNLSAFAEGHPGLRLENKGIALALHYRARPELEADCRAAVLAAITGHDTLQVLDGKMVIEVKPAAADKGRAVQRFMQDSPFAGRIPVFVGDDVTDEDGFRAARALGGFGIKIGEGDTAAQWRIGTVSEFLRWLDAMPGRLDHASKEMAAP